MKHLRSRFPKPPCPPKVDSEIMLGETPPRMQQTMDVTRETPAPTSSSLVGAALLLGEWIEWARSTGREAHAADLIERTRKEIRNQ